MPVAPAPLPGPTTPLTAPEYLRLIDRGAFGEASTELIDGRVTFEMGRKRLHYAAIRRILRSFQILEERGFFAESQGSVLFDEANVPEPDVFLTSLDPDLLTREIVAGDLILAVEVAVSSLGIDRRIKSRLYASAGVPEYWIVNPLARQVEVYRQPQGEAYAERVVYDLGETVSPLIAPDHTIPVDALMPPLDSEPA